VSTSYDEVTTWERDGEGWSTCLPEDWMQGRGAFGGILAAAALRALRTRVPADRPPRTVSTTFYGPVTAEPARMEVKVLRQGRSVTFAEAEIVQGGTLRVRVQGAFGADRPTTVQVPWPTATIPELDSAVQFAYRPGVIPQFIQNVDSRWTEGAFPFTGQPGHELASFLRFRQPATRGPERLLGLIDILPAPVLQQVDGPTPASTITWTAHLVAPDSGAPGDWSFFRYKTITAQGGYSSAGGHLYGLDGRLIAWQEQLHAVFG